jgi:hypothetical protein
MLSWFEEAQLGGSAVPTGPELQRTHGHMERPGNEEGPTVAERVVDRAAVYHPHGPPSHHSGQDTGLSLRCLALADQLVRPLFAWQPRQAASLSNDNCKNYFR